MQNSWSLRDELLAASQRWPLILLYILIGSLLGWGVAYLLPGPYQAMRELYVGLDVYRAFEDRNVPIEAVLVNDYKNWQMENLELLARSERVLQPLLADLRQQDAYWNTLQPLDLLSMMRVYYRNAGDWQLVVEHDQRQRAIQLVDAWQAALLPVVQNALEQTRQVYVLDERLKALAAAQAETTAQLAQNQAAQAALQSWSTALGALPAEQPVSSAVHAQGRAPLELDGAGAPWQSLLQAYPPPDAPASDYQDWLAGAQAALEGQAGILLTRADGLQSEIDEVAAQYAVASQSSLALSANLVLEPAGEFPAQVTRLHPAALLALVGGLLGLCAWILLWLGRIAWRRQDQGALPGSDQQPGDGA